MPSFHLRRTTRRQLLIFPHKVRKLLGLRRQLPRKQGSRASKKRALRANKLVIARPASNARSTSIPDWTRLTREVSLVFLSLEFGWVTRCVRCSCVVGIWVREFGYQFGQMLKAVLHRS